MIFKLDFWSERDKQNIQGSWGFDTGNTIQKITTALDKSNTERNDAELVFTDPNNPLNNSGQSKTQIEVLNTVLHSISKWHISPTSHEEKAKGETPSADSIKDSKGSLQLTDGLPLVGDKDEGKIDLLPQSNEKIALQKDISQEASRGEVGVETQERKAHGRDIRKEKRYVLLL